MNEHNIKTAVRQRYGKIVTRGGSCCGSTPSCCATNDLPKEIGRGIGYSEEEMNQVPDGSNLGLGCGNPVALASLKRGDTVLDLGSGAGLDCFLASKAVGPAGTVIGVDMTPEMIAKARENARRGGYGNVEFRLGEIEDLPVADGSVDAILSNCVINLVPDKKKAFTEAFRVLRPGGRMMISDLVLLKPLTETIRSSVAAYTGCVAGASLKGEYLSLIEDAGFRDVQVAEETPFGVEGMLDDPTVRSIIDGTDVSMEDAVSVSRSVSSIRVFALKPKRTEDELGKWKNS